MSTGRQHDRVRQLEDAIRQHRQGVLEATEAFKVDSRTKLDPTDADKQLWAHIDGEGTP